jgi:WD40 repeat protein
MMFTLTPAKHRAVYCERGVQAELMATLTGHSGSVVAVSFSPNDKLLASASRDGTVRLWLLREAETQTVWELGHPVLSVVFSPDGELLAAGGHGGVVGIYRVNEGKAAVEMELRNEVVQSVSFSPDGKLLAIGTGVWDERERRLSTGSVKLWSLDGNEFVAERAGFEAPINSVAFSPDGKFFAMGSWDGKVRIWQAEPESPKYTVVAHTGWVRCVAFSPDGKLLATPGFSYQPMGSWWETPIPIWRTDDGKLQILLRAGLLGFIRGHRGPVNSAVFSPNGYLIASGGNDKTVKIWHIEGRLLCSLEGHIGLVNSVAFSSDGKFLASADSDGSIFLWRIISLF